MTLAAALDLGSSQLKTGILTEAGRIELRGRTPAPLLKGRGAVRIVNPQIYLEKATQLVQALNLPKETPLGISSQRSSFVLWNARTGKTLTPLISWQDLRAQSWCLAHAEIRQEVEELTGLPFSPHYVAAKLAMLLETTPILQQTASRGLLRFGTLETYLIWNWTRGDHFHTDLSMAARTQLVDPREPRWSKRLLSLFGIPVEMLPTIATGPISYTSSLHYPIKATIADQAACALPIFHSEPGTAFINAGTATFVMRASSDQPPPGVLQALVPGARGRAPFRVWEAPINAGAAVLRDFRLPGEGLKMQVDPSPDAFGIADVAGLGAPYWRPELAEHMSESARELDYAGRKRVAFESLVFRTRELVELLFPDGCQKVVLSGGLSARFDFTQCLAGVLKAPLHLLKEKELSLWGAAWMASGCGVNPKFYQKQVHPRFEDTYLVSKYPEWKAWLGEVTALTAMTS